MFAPTIRTAFSAICSPRRWQLDEIWAWIFCKEKNRTPEIAAKHPEAGDIWLWVAFDADTKLVPSWALGDRTLKSASAFVADLAARVEGASTYYR